MLPFTMHEFRLYIPATVNGVPTYAFLDTGATRCDISPSLAKDLPVTRTSMVHGALRAQRANRVRIDTVGFLDEMWKDIEVGVDASGAFTTVPFDVGITLDASRLLAKPLALSFKEQMLGFVKPPLREDLMCVPLELFKTLPFITCVLDGKPLRTIFDTGAGYSVINKARQEELAPSSQYAYSLNEVGDVTGARETISVWESPLLEVGGIELGACTFLAMDLGALEAKMQTQVDFILGINTLLASNLVLVVDAPKQKLCIAPHGTVVTQL
jgi:predicted aspartyl protease